MKQISSSGLPRKNRTKKKHTIHDKNGNPITVNLTRSLAIKACCTECLGFEDNPSNCTSLFCPLYPFRGKTMISSGRSRSKHLSHSLGDDFQKKKSEKKFREASK